MAAQGKFFFIKSKLNDLVLTVQDGDKAPGTPVVPMEKKDFSEWRDQLWFVDGLTSTVRSKMHEFCLDINEDNTLIVNPYKSGDTNQQFEVAGDRLCQRANSLSVVDIAEADEDPGARVCVFEYSGDDNQRWEFDYLPPRFFYLISERSGMVLDIRGGVKDAGIDLITWTKHPHYADNQLWYEDKDGRIRSKLTNFLIDTSKAKDAQVNPDEFGNPGQNWVVVKNRIVNQYNTAQCLEIKKKSKKKKATMIIGQYKGDPHQHWKLEYVPYDATFREKVSDAEDDDDDDDDDEDESD